jgi:energy-coupling factor transporter ATP-binding protein EcfA2
MTRPIRTLSGGERNRVALALITFHRPHVLLLDEITNHLDMGTVESLVESLREFEGALVVGAMISGSSGKLLKGMKLMKLMKIGKEAKVFCIL